MATPTYLPTAVCYGSLEGNSYFAPEPSTATQIAQLTSTTADLVSSINGIPLRLGPDVYQVPGWESTFVEVADTSISTKSVIPPISGNWKVQLVTTYTMSNAPAAGLSTTQAALYKSSDFGSTFSAIAYGPSIDLTTYPQGKSINQMLVADVPNLDTSTDQISPGYICVGGTGDSGAVWNFSNTQMWQNYNAQAVSTLTVVP